MLDIVFVIVRDRAEGVETARDQTGSWFPVGEKNNQQLERDDERSLVKPRFVLAEFCVTLKL